MERMENRQFRILTALGIIFAVDGHQFLHNFSA